MRNQIRLLSIIILLIINGCVKSSEISTSEGKIFFERWGKGWKEVELWIMDIDGKNQELLIKQHSIKNLPKGKKIAMIEFSPSLDMKKIAFIVLLGEEDLPYSNESNIYIMNIDGTNQAKLTKEYIDAGPKWSPDGKKIVFTSNRSGRKGWEIYTIDVDGTNIVKLTDNFVGDGSPNWSPDGKKIVFTSGVTGTDLKSLNKSEIFTMNADGTDLKRLTNNSVDDNAPTWSPDGKRIAFAHRYMLYIMDADGKNQIQLTNGTVGVHSPSWLPKENKIVFSGLIYEVNNSDIFVIDIKTKKLTNLTNTPDIDETHPCWRPIPKD